MRPKERQGLTTGEVARKLGISQSTAIELFDRGILTGWKHPGTSWRVIDRKSTDALAKLKGWSRGPRSRKTSKILSGSETPPPKQGLTTREVEKMLGGIISQRTVIRYFDKGILKGGRHPVTGWRLIDPKSVEALKRKWAVMPVTHEEGKR